MDAAIEIKKHHALAVLARIIARRYLADQTCFKLPDAANDEQENEENSKDQSGKEDIS